MSNSEVGSVAVGAFEVEDFKDYLSNPFYDLDGMETFYFTYDENMSQVALEKIYKALYAYRHPGQMETAKADYEAAAKELTEAANEVNRQNGLLGEYEVLLDKIKAIEADGSAVGSDYNLVMVSLLGEDPKARTIGGELGELYNFFADVKNKLSTAEANSIELSKYQYYVDTILKAIKGNPTKDPFSRTTRWPREYTTIDNFYKKWTAEAKYALEELYNFFCAEKIGCESIASKFNIAVSSLSESFRPDGDSGAALINSTNAAFTDGHLTAMVDNGIVSKSDLVNKLSSNDQTAIKSQIDADFEHSVKCFVMKREKIDENGSVVKDASGNTVYEWYYDNEGAKQEGFGLELTFASQASKTFTSEQDCFDFVKTRVEGSSQAELYKIDNLYNTAISMGKFLNGDSSTVNSVKSLLWNAVTNTRNANNPVIEGIQGDLIVDFEDAIQKRFEERNAVLNPDGYTSGLIESIESFIYSGVDAELRPSGGNNQCDNSGLGLMALADKKNGVPHDVNELRYEYDVNGNKIAGVDLFANMGINVGEIKTTNNVDNLKNTISSKISNNKNDVDKALSEYSKKLEAYKTAEAACLPFVNSDISELLDLALRYNSFDGGQSLLDGGKSVQMITNISYVNGEYTATTSPVSEKSQVNAQDAMKDLAIPYYALTICLEKANIVRDVMVAQVQILQNINDAIERNNEYLKEANKCYEGYYRNCINNTKNGTFNHPTNPQYNLDEYVTNECGYKFSSKNIKYGVYNKEGTSSKSNGFTNIDVEEQGNLTKISNAQEAIRMKGDELNTSSQMATTKLQQYTQNYNSSISIASQLAKSVGENFKNIASNVR